MKPVGTLSSLMVFGVALAATTMFTSSAQAGEGKAVVRSVRGTAQSSVQGGEWKPLNVNQVLGSGSAIKAGTSSSVDLFLAENGPVVRVTQDTTLELDKLSLDRAGVDVVIETQLDLKAGTILGSVKKLAAASRYEVKTPYTVCAIKGTEYQISADGVHHAITGTLLVVYTNPSTKNPTTLTVNAGQTFVPPLNPSTPNAVPTVVATGTLPATQQPAPPPPVGGPGDFEQPVTVVPEPVTFVSPGTGSPSTGTGTR